MEKTFTYLSKIGKNKFILVYTFWVENVMREREREK